MAESGWASSEEQAWIRFMMAIEDMFNHYETSAAATSARRLPLMTRSAIINTPHCTYHRTICVGYAPAVLASSTWKTGPVG